jgi:hypothetical protein
VRSSDSVLIGRATSSAAIALLSTASVISGLAPFRSAIRGVARATLIPSLIQIGTQEVTKMSGTKCQGLKVRDAIGALTALKRSKPREVRTLN